MPRPSSATSLPAFATPGSFLAVRPASKPSLSTPTPRHAATSPTRRPAPATLLRMTVSTAAPTADDALEREPAAEPAAEPASPAAQERLANFVRWFQGDFDNCYQVAEQREQGVGRGGHEHMHCRVTPIVSKVLAAPDEAVVFANYYYNGRPDVVYRQRMYKMSVSGSDDIVMRIYKMRFIHGLKVAKCNTDFSGIDLGSLEDNSLYEYLEGAEVFWRYVEEEHPGSALVTNGPHFLGYMREGGWITPDKLRIEDNLVLTRDDLWVAEQVFNAEGTMVAGNRDGVSHKMQRVRQGSEMFWTVDPTIAFIPSPEE